MSTKLPEDNVEVQETGSVGGSYGGYDYSRFEDADPFGNTYETPGWQRAQRNQSRNAGRKRNPDVPMIEGEVIARSTGTGSKFELGERVFHQKFGYGKVIQVDGTKLTVEFEMTGSKRVLDSFLERH